MTPGVIGRTRARGNTLRWVAVILMSWAGASASAHEFWVLPGTFLNPRPGPVTLGLFVGVQFQGARVAFNRTVVSRLADVTASGAAELASGVAAEDAVGDFTFDVTAPGAHVIVMDSLPSRIELPAETFNAYLENEGLVDVLAARKSAEALASPGRERFRRNVKTLVQVGAPLGDEAYSMRVGQKLEIVPLRNPALAHMGEQVAFKVFFDGQPLQGALMKSWFRQGTQTLVSSALTDAAGTVSFAFGFAGTWMVSVVRMVPEIDTTPGLDWDSYWASLTFRVPR